MSDLVDQRKENSSVVLVTNNFCPTSPIKESNSYILNFTIGDEEPHPQSDQTFDLSHTLRMISNKGPSWSSNLFLTTLAVARAESLGSSKVFVPSGFFPKEYVSNNFNFRLNNLVNEGTDRETEIEVIFYPSINQTHMGKAILGPKKSLVLASGGTDNTVAAALKKRLGSRIGMFQVIYGQAARYQEKWCVDELMEDLELIQLTRLELDVLKHYGGSALLRDDMQLKEDNLFLEYVPFRNSIFLASGLMVANQESYNSLILGAHPDDTMAPDGTRTYVDSFNDLLNCFNFNTPSIEAPLLYYGGKPELIELGLELGVDFSHTWSCHTFVPEYDAGNKAEACGTCGNCITRYSAFEKLGKVDPVEYKEKPPLRKNWAGKKEDHHQLRKKLLLSDN